MTFATIAHCSQHVVLVLSQRLEYRRRSADAMKRRDELLEVCIVGVVQPRSDRQRILRLERVRGRRVVDDDCAFERPTKKRKVFDVQTIYFRAVLPVEAMMHPQLLWINVIQNSVCIGGNAGSEDSNLKAFANKTEELSQVRSERHKNWNSLRLNWNIEREVARHLLDRSMDEGLIQVKDKKRAPKRVRVLARQQKRSWPFVHHVAALGDVLLAALHRLCLGEERRRLVPQRLVFL